MISSVELSEKVFTGIDLPEPYVTVFGQLPENFSLAIWGPAGSGKSTVAVDLAWVLANTLGKGIYCSSEEGSGPSMQNKFKRLKAEHPDLYIKDFDGLEDLKSAIKYGNAKFCIFDSASMSHIKVSEMEDIHDFCKKQNVAFIYILHATKTGDFKGNSYLIHMPDTVLKVEEGIAKTEKNRFAETPQEFEVQFETSERENPSAIQTRKVDEDILAGVEFIENPAEVEDELRENKGVSPDDIYEMITNNIISVIESEGELPWQKEYDTSMYDHGMATNFVSKKAYSGINWVLLNFFKWVKVDGEKKLVEGSFSNPYFLTFKQIEKLGGKLKKGAVGQIAVYYTKLYSYKQADPELEFSTYKRDEMIKWIEAHRSQISLLRTFSADEITDQSYYPILKYYNIFNGEDIEGIQFGKEVDTTKLSAADKIKVAEAIYSHFPEAPKVVHEKQKPFYKPEKDIINMPVFGSYNEPQYYYSTLFHEAVHATGHKKRLDRDSLHNYSKDDNRPFEELIAEMGAAYLSGEAGILFKTLHQSAAYLQGWNSALVKQMEEDHKYFFRAAARAQDAADYILDRDENGVPAYIKDINVEGLEEKETVDTFTIEEIAIDIADYLLWYKGKQVKHEPQLVVNNFFNTKEKTDYLSKIPVFQDRKSDPVAYKAYKKNFDAVTTEKVIEIVKAKLQDRKAIEASDDRTIDIYFDTKKPVTGQYDIIEAKNLIPSHNKDCSQNSKHLISKAQPRDRSGADLCNQSKLMAQKLNPDLITIGNKAFDGAPVTLPDGQVIQGNGRSIALKIAYDEYENQADEYRNYLLKNASKFGLTRDYVEGFSQPVLVRKVDVSEGEAIRLGNIVDNSQAKMNRLDQAKAYIRQLDEQKRQIIGRIINSSSGETLGEIIDDKGLMILDQLKDLDRIGLVQDNALTGDGKDFIRQLFAGLVFDSDENKDALKHFAKLLHNTKAGIERSYGFIIPFIGTKRDIAPTLQKSIEIVQQVQNSESIDTIKDYLAQGDAFTGINRDRFSEKEVQLAEFLLPQNTQKAIKEAFQVYYFKNIGRNDLLNPVEKVSPELAFQDAFVEQVRINPPEELVKLYTPAAFKKGDVVRDYYDNIKYKMTSKRKGTYYFKNMKTGRRETFRKSDKRFLRNRDVTPTLSLFRDNGVKYKVDGEIYTASELIDFVNTLFHYEMQDYDEPEITEVETAIKALESNGGEVEIISERENPSTLAYMGITEKVTISSASGLKELKGKFPTFLAGDKLYIIPKNRVQKVKNKVTDKKAVEAFEEFNNYSASDVDYKIDFPEDKSIPVGSAKTIWYASDKEIQAGDRKGKINHYVHEFDDGKRPAIVKGDVLVIGNIEWDERGLLN